jgi:hypothetical protein
VDEELQELVELGLRLTDERIRQSPEFSLYRSIRAQLEFIVDHVEGRTPIAESDRRRLILGVLAAREFETSDPDYADVLFKVSYLVNRWDPS